MPVRACNLEPTTCAAWIISVSNAVVGHGAKAIESRLRFSSFKNEEKQKHMPLIVAI